MAKELAIRVFMNSNMEAVLNFKTACSLKLFDQNLEIHVRNSGSEPVVIHSHIDLEGEQGIVAHIDNLFPTGDQRIAPGEIKAFYGQLDDRVWAASRRLIFYDTDGTPYSEPIGS
jgi:hypothetical protein